MSTVIAYLERYHKHLLCLTFIIWLSPLFIPNSWQHPYYLYNHAVWFVMLPSFGVLFILTGLFSKRTYLIPIGILCLLAFPITMALGYFLLGA